MKRTSLPRPAAPIALAAGLALGLASASLAHGAPPSQVSPSKSSPSIGAPSIGSGPQNQRTDVESAMKGILAVVDPQAASSPQETPMPQGASPSNLKGAISSLMSKGEANAIFKIGIGAVPALRVLADGASIRDLVLDHESTSPLFYLVKMAPLEALAYYEARLEDDIERFKALAFVDHGGLLTVTRRLNEEGQQEQALALFERACTDRRLDRPFRVRLAMEALGAGVSTPKAEDLLLANEAMWLKRQGVTEALAGLYVEKKGLPTASIAPNLAAILWGHSLEVDQVLARHEDPKVRVQLAERMWRAQRSADLFPPDIIERIPLLVEQALREDSQERPRYFAAIENTLRPTRTSPILPLGTLSRLISSSAKEAGVSTRLSLAIGYQISHLTWPFDEIQEKEWLLLLRAIASCSNPQLKAKYSADVERYIGYVPMKLAYASVILEGGNLRTDNFFRKANSFAGSETSQAEQADARLRLAQLFGKDKERLEVILERDRPFDALDPARFGDAISLYGEAGSTFHKRAISDASQWARRDPAPLAKLCSASDLSWSARAIAAVGLLQTNDPDDGALAAEVLIEQGKDQVKLVASLVRLRPSQSNNSRAWTEFIARLLVGVDTRPELLEILPYDPELHYATIGQRPSIVAGAKSMAQIGSARSKLSSMSESLTSWMTQDSALQDDSLILRLLRFRPWIGNNTDLPSLALSRPGIRGETMQLLLAGIRNGQGAEQLIPSVLNASGEGELNNLVQAVVESSNTNLLDVLETRLATMARVKTAQQRWSSASASTPTKQAAIGKVLALLESEDENVRVEAILGLSTLGAVEALPTLIGMLGSGSVREKAAAKESLSFLREVAKNQSRQDWLRDPLGEIPHRPVVAPSQGAPGKQ